MKRCLRSSLIGFREPSIGIRLRPVVGYFPPISPVPPPPRSGRGEDELRLLEFFRVFLSGALKDNSHLARGW